MRSFSGNNEDDCVIGFLIKALGVHISVVSMVIWPTLTVCIIRLEPLRIWWYIIKCIYTQPSKSNELSAYYCRDRSEIKIILAARERGHSSSTGREGETGAREISTLPLGERCRVSTHG